MMNFFKRSSSRDFKELSASSTGTTDDDGNNDDVGVSRNDMKDDTTKESELVTTSEKQKKEWTVVSSSSPFAAGGGTSPVAAAASSSSSPPPPSTAAAYANERESASESVLHHWSRSMIAGVPSMTGHPPKQERLPRYLPLSMQLMGKFCCQECGSTKTAALPPPPVMPVRPPPSAEFCMPTSASAAPSFTAITTTATSTAVADSNAAAAAMVDPFGLDEATDVAQLYNECYRTMETTKSAVSPYVMAPMILRQRKHNLPSFAASTTTSTSATTTSAMTSSSSSDVAGVTLDQLMREYHEACRLYDCTVNSGVLATLRYQLPSLRVAGSFHDADMMALSEILSRHCNGALKFIKRLDFRRGSKEGKGLHRWYGFKSHGGFALAKVLQISQHIEEIYMQRNRIGPYGASAIFLAAAKNGTLHTLGMRRCRIGEQGALAFAEVICRASHFACGLREVDLSANVIGYRGCLAIEQALQQHDRTVKVLTVDLEGNLVLQEVMNGVTHGLGVLFGLIGVMFLSRRVRGMPQHYVISCALYSTSLLVLYVSSTLYHSFFTLQHTKYVFEVLDKCAIYILIAGSYTPFLQIVLGHNPTWSVGLLLFIWSCCLCGILVEAFLPVWPSKGLFSLSLYLGMGWSCVVCLPELIEILPQNALHLLVLGGVGYTSGVPFFIRNNNLDHSIWHLFVLAGSIFHWFGIYIHVAVWDPQQ